MKISSPLPLPAPIDKHSRAHACLIAVTLIFLFTLVSCETPERQARKLLEENHVEVSGLSLLSALEDSRTEIAEALLTLGVGAGSRDEKERTPLMLAAAGSSGSLIPSLVEAGAYLDARDSDGRTALGYAIESNDLEAVVRLLESGATASIEVETGGTLVAQAIRQGKTASSHLLLDAGADPGSKGTDGESLVQIAIEENQPTILDKLAEKGVDFKTQKGTGDGLLHLALKSGQDEILAYLMEHGLDPDDKNARGDTLLHSAVGTARPELIPLLKKHGADVGQFDAKGWSATHLAILARNHDLLATLLDHGADVNQFSRQGEDSIAPLSLAIQQRLFPMARLLLRYGAAPRDELYKAVKRGGKDGHHLTKLLLESGASPSPSRAPALDSPIGLAVRTGEYEIAKLLLDYGASHEVRDLCGQKPFHIAVAQGNPKLVALLLAKGADPNEPFHSPVTEDFLEQVRTDGIGRWALKKSKTLYPIMLASDSGNIEVVRQLMQHGAHTTKSTKVHRSRMWPLTFATRRSDTDMMQVILGKKPGRGKTWVKVDLSEQRAYIYQNDKVVFKSRVSTGKRGYRTRKGKFVITNKYRHWNSTIYGSSMPYFQRLSASDFGFHVGVIPGYPASHGCIRMPHSAARKLFGMTDVGDYVEIVP